MNCLDPAEIPTIQPFDVDTFEDEDRLGSKTDAEAVQICGFHPKVGQVTCHTFATLQLLFIDSCFEIFWLEN